MNPNDNNRLLHNASVCLGHNLYVQEFIYIYHWWSTRYIFIFSILYNYYQRLAKYKVIVDRLIGQQNKLRVLRCQTKLETHFSFHSNKMKWFVTKEEIIVNLWLMLIAIFDYRSHANYHFIDQKLNCMFHHWQRTLETVSISPTDRGFCVSYCCPFLLSFILINYNIRI